MILTLEIHEGTVIVIYGKLNDPQGDDEDENGTID